MNKIKRYETKKNKKKEHKLYEKKQTLTETLWRVPKARTGGNTKNTKEKG